MKKILFLGLTVLASSHLMAQKMNPRSDMFTQTAHVKKQMPVSDGSHFNLSTPKPAPKKTRATPFYTENFSTGTAASLPTGWTAASVAGVGTWKWANAASTSQYSIGAIQSTSASNGWMIYDADAIHTASGGVASVDGYLTSPVISCAGHPTVMLRMEQHYRAFTDSCTIFVSNNGTTWTEFSVQPNNSTPVNTSLPTNPHFYNLNISSVAANSATVQVRFRMGTGTNGGYSWLIDDLSLSELDPIDASISKSFIAYVGDGGFASYASIPKSFADSVIMVTQVSNIGSTALAAVPVTVTTSNPAVVNTQTESYLNLPVNGLDSFLQFSTPYLPATVADYSVGFKANVTGDAVALNDVDSTFYSVSDSIFSQNTGALSGYYVHRAPATGVTELSLNWATLFEIPAGKSDTVTALYASFASSTTTGSEIRARIFKFDAASTAWNEVLTCNVTKLVASNISTTSVLRFARFEIPFNNAAILDEGTYAAVIDPSLVLTNQTVVIYASETPAIFNVGANDDVDFASAGLPSGFSQAPMIRMSFARKNNSIPDGINEVSNFSSVNAFPNPTSDNVTFMLNLKESAKNVTITLANTLGQAVKTIDLGAVTANTEVASKVNIADLSSGLYIYTINADGQKFQTN